MNEPARAHATEVGQFYDALWGSGPSVAALVHGEGYIGQECLLMADEIEAFAQRAGMTAGASVLDIGSGKGGPACYLAQQFGCRVLGVDVSVVGHVQAEARARDLGLRDLVQFRLGDIHAMELPPAAFDVVIGLDAWCHIPQRPALLQRCAHLLRAGGRLAFFDHVERQPLTDEQRRDFCAHWRFAGLETPASYLDAVRAAGLELLSYDERSDYAARFYTRLEEVFVAERLQFEAISGPERYLKRLERLHMTQRLASTGVLGQLACIAVKPGN
jgi:cyclopropane fatty-acyl-phospholipid synthase-like methyltransferase